MMFLIEISEYVDDVLIERSEYDDDVSMLMMFLIERSECDDDYVRQIRI